MPLTLLLRCVGVAVGDTASASSVLSFAFLPPTVSSLSVASGNTSGGYNVTIFGANFGSATDFASSGFLYIDNDVVCTAKTAVYTTTCQNDC